MLSLALDRFVGLALCACVLSSCGSGLAVAQDQAADPTRFSEMEWRDNFYGIRARGSGGTRMEISFEPGRALRATGWLEQNGSRWTVTMECEAFISALEAFRHLPALKPGPIILQPDLPAAIPVPPRKTGGESWVIRTSAYAPNWSSNEIELRGLGGPYPFWVDDTVEAIKRCGPPTS